MQTSSVRQHKIVVPIADYSTAADLVRIAVALLSPHSADNETNYGLHLGAAKHGEAATILMNDGPVSQEVRESLRPLQTV